MPAVTGRLAFRSGHRSPNAALSLPLLPALAVPLQIERQSTASSEEEEEAPLDPRQVGPPG